MKFIKPFRGVPDGEIYPVDYEAGDECPAELLESATALKAIEGTEADEADDAKPGRKK